MNLSDEDLLSKYNSQANITYPLNLPPPGECNWDYADGNEVLKSFNYDPYHDDFEGFENFNTRQSSRCCLIWPRSWWHRPTVPPETATTYKCSFYRKYYSKRRPILPRNHFRRSCAPPPRWTMNQLSYTNRLKQRMWY